MTVGDAGAAVEDLRAGSLALIYGYRRFLGNCANPLTVSVKKKTSLAHECRHWVSKYRGGLVIEAAFEHGSGQAINSHIVPRRITDTSNSSPRTHAPPGQAVNAAPIQPEAGQVQVVARPSRQQNSKRAGTSPTRRAAAPRRHPAAARAATTPATRAQRRTRITRPAPPAAPPRSTLRSVIRTSHRHPHHHPCQRRTRTRPLLTEPPRPSSPGTKEWLNNALQRRRRRCCRWHDSGCAQKRVSTVPLAQQSTQLAVRGSPSSYSGSRQAPARAREQSLLRSLEVRVQTEVSKGERAETQGGTEPGCHECPGRS